MTPRDGLLRLSELMAEEVARLEAMDPAERAEEARRFHAEQAAAAPLEPPALPWPRIPRRFAAVTFDNYAPENDSERAGLRAARKFVDMALEGRSAMLALIGSTGAGKSHLLYAAAAALRAAGRPFYSRPWYTLAEELRWGGDNPWSGTPEDARVLRSLLWESREVVLLDEVNFTGATEFDRLELHKFTHHAWDQRMAVLLTTPVAPLSDILGPQAASRFVSVVIEGRDRRKT